MNEQQQASFCGWAKVEVMGHQSHVGYVKTEAYGQAVLFRIDTPELPERECLLDEPAYAADVNGNSSWAPAGAKVSRPASPGVSVLVGSGSIYRIVPCTEAVAMKAIEQGIRSPLKLVELPPSLAIAQGTMSGATDDSDLCDDCGNHEDFCCCDELGI